MSTSTLGLFLRHLALSEEVSRLKSASDRDLLAAYEPGRSGQAAFTELMRRHGPMVLRTCRRVLDQESDAEDAFQATFVLLARKAGSINKREALGGWLHRVAYHTALKVLTGKIRRRTQERQACAMTHSPSDPVTKATWNEIQPILDAELNTLPEEARQLLIACYLQDKTHAEAAVELGLPRGSVAWRLDKARALLAARLNRRGITVSATLLVVLLGESARGAGVPAVLLVHTIEAARTFTQQAVGVLSENVLRLVQGGLAQMGKSSSKPLGLILAGWVSLLGAGLIVCQTLKAWPERTRPSGEAPAVAAERAAQERNKQTRTDYFGDPLPDGATARMGTTRLRHTLRVTQVYFSPDGQTAASGGIDGSVRLWDVATGKLVRSLKHPGAQGLVRPEAFCRDDKTLITATLDQIWLWDVKTGQQLRYVKLKQPPNQQVFALAVSSDGKTAASGENDGIIRLWDAVSGNPLRVLHGPGKSVLLLSFSPDKKMLASWASGSNTNHVVQLWDVSNGELLHELKYPPQHPERGITAIAFSPDSKTLASGGIDETVRLWDAATGKLLHTLEGHPLFILSLSFSPNGKMLASGGWDKTIRLWDVTAGKALRKVDCSLPVVRSLAFAPDSKMLAATGSGPAVRLWDVTTGKHLPRPQKAHQGGLHSLAFSPDGRMLATAAGTEEPANAVRLWDSSTGKRLRGLEHPGGALAVAFTADGKTLASAGSGQLLTWETATGKPLHQGEIAIGPPLAFSPAALSKTPLPAVEPDNRKKPGSVLRFWDVAAATPLRALEQPEQIVSVALAPDGKTLAVATSKGFLCLRDAATGKDLPKVDKFPMGAASVLAFAPDGKTQAVASFDRGHHIHLLEVASGKKLHTLMGHLELISALAFSPSGRLLASGSYDQTVRLWEVNAGLASQGHEFRGHEAPISAVAFSPDGRRLASASYDSTALVWDVTGQADRQPRTARLTQDELTTCWQSLTSTDAAHAYRARRTLAAAPQQAVPFLADRLQEQSRKRPDPQRIARLLVELDSDDFVVRSQAAKELGEWGEAAEPALRQALKGNPSPEVRRSVRQLLDAMHPQGVSPRLLRESRVVEVLEWIDNPAGRELLKKLAAGTPQEEIGRQAAAALGRLHNP